MNILKKNYQMKLENAYEALFVERDLKRHPKYDEYLYEWSIIWLNQMKKIIDFSNIHDLNSMQIEFLAKNPNLHPQLFLDEIISQKIQLHWLLSYNPSMTMDFWNELKSDKYKNYHHIFDFSHDIHIFHLQQKRLKVRYNENFEDYDTLIEKIYEKKMSEFPCVNIDFVNSHPPDTFCHFLLAQNPIITFDDMNKNPQYRWHTTICYDPDWDEEDCKFNSLILNPNITFNVLQKIKDNKFTINYQEENIIIPYSKYNRYRIFENTFTLIRVQFILQKIILCNEERKKMLKELIIEAWRPERFEEWCL